MTNPLAGRVCVGLAAAIVTSVAAGEALELTGGGLRMAIDPEGGGRIVSLRDEMSGREWATRTDRGLLRLAVREGGNQVAQLQEAARLGLRCAATRSEDGRELRLDWTGGDTGLRVAGRLIAAQDHLAWWLRLQNPRRLVIERIGFPAMPMAGPLEDAQRDGFVLPHHDGCLLPARAWAIGVPGRSVAGTQPGAWSMQWIGRSDGERGFMVGTRDASGFVKGYALTRLQEALQLEIVHSFAAEGHEALEVPYPVVMQSCPGDWHEMADAYREWAVRQPWCRSPLRGREDIPKAARDAGAMAMVSYRTATTPAQQAVEVVRQALRKWAQVGAGPLLIHTRGWEKHGTWVAQDYFPPFPDEETFAATSREARQQGSEHLVFLSGYVWTRTFGKKDDGSFEYDSRDYFDRELKRHAVLEPNGEVHVRPSSWLQGGENAELCRGDEWSRELILRVTEQLRGYGVGLVQIDQLVGGGGPVCYAANHGHPPGPGQWMHQAVVDQMERLLQEGRAQGEFGLSLEEPNELYVPYLALYHARDHQVHGWPLPSGAEPLPLFAYVYHEYARGYSGWITHGIQGFREGNYGIALRYTTALALANGKLLGFPVGFASDDMGVAGENRLLVAGARLATGLGKPWLVYGRMVSPPRLQCGTIQAVRTGQKGENPAVYQWPGVVHRAYEDKDRGRAVVLVNHTREKQRAALAPTDGWQPEQVIRSGAEGVRIEALDPKAGPSVALELAPQEVVLVALGKAVQ